MLHKYQVGRRLPIDRESEFLGNPSLQNALTFWETLVLLRAAPRAWRGSPDVHGHLETLARAGSWEELGVLFQPLLEDLACSWQLCCLLPPAATFPRTPGMCRSSRLPTQLST